MGKYYLTISDEFLQYCKLNNITDIQKKVEETFMVGFNVIKYGREPKPTINIKPQIDVRKQSDDNNKKNNDTIYEE